VFDVENLKKIISTYCQGVPTNLVVHTEGFEYGACSFVLDNQKVEFRTAKITPKKIGQFVTFYKRAQSGIIEPFCVEDDFDQLMVFVKTGEICGLFIFSKKTLALHDVISVDGHGGKRAMRVYPIWDQELNAQAQKTQNWQKEFFRVIVL
jgi:hypothetical protein